MTSVQPIKDSDKAHEIASVWRPKISAIVDAFVEAREGNPILLGDDVELANGVVQFALEQIAEYGESLISLPDETWKTSQSQWMDGHWTVLVDLWTTDSKPSDMVLFVDVKESGDSFVFKVVSLHVP